MTLIHDQLNKTRVQKIIWLFQKKAIKVDNQEESSQYIIETIKLIEVDYTLTKTRRLIQLNSKWMIRDEQQTKKRINRITQTRQTYIYALLFKDSRVEKMIYDRQHKRAYMMQLALNHKEIEIEKITRDVDDDENDDNELKKSETFETSHATRNDNVWMTMSRI